MSGIRRNIFRELWNTCPVTLLFVAVALGLQICVTFYAITYPRQADDAHRVFGAATMLQYVQQTELGGLFSLWRGEIWRVPVSGFHHGGWLHLVMNSSALLFFGFLLERFFTRAGYVGYFLAATTVSLVPEFLLEHTPIGLSGAAYAMFGTLLVLRQTDVRVAEYFTESMVRFGFFWLVACVFLTYFDLMAIANIAHFAGLTYGWLAGELLFGRFSRAAWARPAFNWMHLLLIPAFYFLMNPFWLGRYHWELANQAGDVETKIAHLKKAVEVDPGLGPPWNQIAKHQIQKKQPLEAWNTVLTGVKYNRSFKPSLELAKLIGLGLAQTGQLQQANQIVDEVFGDEAELWKPKLIPTDIDQLPKPESRLATSPGQGFINGRLGRFRGRSMQLWTEDEIPVESDDDSAPTVNPTDPTSAAEGQST